MKRKKIKIHFKPDKTIAENAKDIGVSYDTIKKYMQRNGLSKQGFNFNIILEKNVIKNDLLFMIRIKKYNQHQTKIF